MGLISVIGVALQSTSKCAKTSVLIGAVVLVPTVEGRDEDGQSARAFKHGCARVGCGSSRKQ